MFSRNYVKELRAEQFKNHFTSIHNCKASTQNTAIKWSILNYKDNIVFSSVMPRLLDYLVHCRIKRQQINLSKLAIILFTVY